MTLNSRLFGGLMVWGLLSACSSLPKSFNALESRAIPQSEMSTLGGLLKEGIERHPSQSGFSPINRGRDAIVGRLALADMAEKTIDAQYFIWAGDASGVLLIDRLIKAADRGVRVRLLLDDMTSHGKDLGLAVLNQHPQIEVRVFNPLGRRYYIRIFRSMVVAFNVGRMTNRMHNKIFVVDNQVAVVGGRNIADEYFGVAKKSNFRDMDLFSVGPIVAEVSQAFDDYWNSPWSVPFEIFKTRIPSGKKRAKVYAELNKDFVDAERSYPYALDWRRETVLNSIRLAQKKLVWASAEVISDPPNKAYTKAERGKSNSQIVNRLASVIATAEREVVIVSPYLILSKGFDQSLGNYAQKNVSFKIFTNSLRSTDALPVVAMYRPLREGILKSGADLYEMRPDAASRSLYIDSSRPKSRLSLHAKMSIVDNKEVFVGTFNLDPRSEHLNTEVGLLVHSPELAQILRTDLDVDFATENSYRLGLKGGDVVWSATTAGTPETYSKDPKAGMWRRLSAFILSLLPIKGQL